MGAIVWQVLFWGIFHERLTLAASIFCLVYLLGLICLQGKGVDVIHKINDPSARIHMITIQTFVCLHELQVRISWKLYNSQFTFILAHDWCWNVKIDLQWFSLFLSYPWTNSVCKSVRKPIHFTHQCCVADLCILESSGRWRLFLDFLCVHLTTELMPSENAVQI